MIKKIRVRNFKSFKDLRLSIGKVNILIGANASGKSNFVDIFRFLRDIAKEGLDNAISLHGGNQHIRNVNIDISENFLIEIEEIPYIVEIEFTESDYKFAKITKKDQIVETFKQNGKQGKTIRLNIFDTLALNDKVSIINSDGIDTVESLNIQSKTVNTIDFRNICILDFDSKPSKMAVPIFAKTDLEEDGKNLVIIIKKILDDPEKKSSFINLVSYLLPYLEDIKVEKYSETHYSLKFKEKYSDKHYLPSPLISDGTINALGLIVALYFQESPLIIIEEPDRGLHPSLISGVMEMMKDAVEHRNKQIIVTTHNPLMLKYADQKDILLIARDENGFSSIKRPYRKKDVKTFLDNGMRFEDLYVNELLEI